MTFDPHCSKLVVVLWVWDKSDLRIHWSFCNRWIKAEGCRQLNSVRLYLMCVYNEPHFAFIATRRVSEYGQRSVCWKIHSLEISRTTWNSSVKMLKSVCFVVQIMWLNVTLWKAKYIVLYLNLKDRLQLENVSKCSVNWYK